MRQVTLLVVLMLASASARAQDKNWTPAPVPSVGSGDIIMPAARAGQPLSDDHSFPFSGLPSDSVAEDGATSADRYNGVATPNLGK